MPLSICRERKTNGAGLRPINSRNQRSGNTEGLEGLKSEAVKKKKRRREMKKD